MRRNVDMLNGNAVKSILIFALPIMLSSLLQYNYIIVDNIIVGRFVSTDALAAVGNVGSINAFIIGAALGLTGGFTIPVAHAFGASDRNKASRYAGNSLFLAFIIGLCLVIIAHLISNPILRLIGTPEDIIEMSSAYVNILYFGIPFQMLSNNFTAISRAVGESRRPLYFYTISVFINLCLDLLFVKEFNWGVEGAAAATIVSQTVAMLMTGIYVLKFNPNISITKKDIIPDIAISLEQLKLGIPVSLQFTITSIGSMCLQSVINSFGKDVMAGMTAANRVENLTNIMMSGPGVATQTFVGQNYGARNYERIIKSVRRILILDLAISVLMSLTLYFGGPFIVGLFMKEPNAAMMAAAKRYLLAIAQCYSGVAVLFVIRNTLQGLGFTYANTIAGAGELIGRLSVAFLVTPVLGFDALCYSAPAAWFIADITLIIIYLIKKHKFRSLIAEAKNNAATEAQQAV